MVTLKFVTEYSHAERLARRIELSAEELSLLLGADRFAPPPADESAVDSLPSLAPRQPASVRQSVTNHAEQVDAVTAPTGDTRSIGDTDLVQAILEGASNFEQLALRAIRERTGEELARIVIGSTAEAMIATGTATALGDGRAFVAPIAPDARAAWALWLSRWMQLAALVKDHAPRGTWDDPTGFPSWNRLRIQTAHRISTARLRQETVFLTLLRIDDAELWNRRSQILVDRPFLGRIAAALDAAVVPGDELARLEDGEFVVVSSRLQAAADIAAALRAEIARLPGDGPRSLVVHTGSAHAPWDATSPDALLELAVQRAAANGSSER